jgi:isocitrate lyase
MDQVAETKKMLQNHPTWDAIEAENVVRMQLQNRFPTGLDIARYTSGIMRKDMADYDANPSGKFRFFS